MKNTILTFSLLAVLVVASGCGDDAADGSGGAGSGTTTDAGPAGPGSGPTTGAGPGTTTGADTGSSGPGGGGGGGAPDCFENPQTHLEIINACTDAEAVDRDPVLPLLEPDGSLPPLP